MGIIIVAHQEVVLGIGIGRLLKDVFLQFYQKRHTSAGGIHPEAIGHGLEDAAALQATIMDIDVLVMLGVELANDVLNQGGFAGPGSAGNGKAFTAA